MSEIEIIKKKALHAVRDIEKREETIPVFKGDLDEYRTKHYMDERDLNAYCSLFPKLRSMLRNDIRVLDIGCGKGNAIHQIANDYECATYGTCVDKSTDDNIIVATADKLPFEDDFFDIVLSVHGVSWEPDQKKAFQEIKRVLKRGGTAFVYLITFSHSIALFIGNSFWEDVDKDFYVHNYEFSPAIQIPDCNVDINEHIFPDEECDGHKTEWMVEIKKSQSNTYMIER